MSSFLDKLSAKLHKLQGEQKDRPDDHPELEPVAESAHAEVEPAVVPPSGAQSPSEVAPTPLNSPSNSGILPKEMIAIALKGGGPAPSEIGSVTFDVSKLGPADVAFERFDEQAVAKWLSDNKFTADVQKKLESYGGQDLLDLSREDILELVGSKEGIRLFNRLKIFRK